MVDFNDDRMCKSVTGLSIKELDVLSAQFGPRYEAYLDSVRPERKNPRRRGGGRKGATPTARAKVYYCLYYLKAYPTIDVLAHTFGQSRSTAHEAIHKMLPVMLSVLKEGGYLPQDAFSTVEEMEAYFKKKGSQSYSLMQPSGSSIAPKTV